MPDQELPTFEIYLTSRPHELNQYAVKVNGFDLPAIVGVSIQHEDLLGNLKELNVTVTMRAGRIKGLGDEDVKAG